jgi:hypothetical protein
MSGLRHPTAREFELYVLGALDPAAVPSFEAHCAACAGCAAGLAGEARLELAFEQVAKRSLRASVLRPGRAAAYGAAGLLAMAAAVMLFVGRPSVSTAGEGSGAAARRPMNDGAILDAYNDALDAG